MRCSSAPPQGIAGGGLRSKERYTRLSSEGLRAVKIDIHTPRYLSTAQGPDRLSRVECRGARVNNCSKLMAYIWMSLKARHLIHKARLVLEESPLTSVEGGTQFTLVLTYAIHQRYIKNTA